MTVLSHGERFTLHALRAYRNNPPAGAEQTTNGSTAVNRIEEVEKRREQALIDQMTGRVQQLHDAATARTDEDDTALDLLEESLNEWAKDLKAGRLDPDDVIRKVAECPPMLRELQHDYDRTAKDAEAAREFMAQDPADFEADQLARFPRLADALPVVTEAWLRGDPGAGDPLAEPRDPSDDRQVEATNHLLGADGA